MANPYPISRRRFVAAAGAGLVVGPMLLSANGAAEAHIPSTAGAPLPAGLFTLGVASGDPLHAAVPQ